MPTQKSLRVLSIIHKNGAPVNIAQVFHDTNTSVTEKQIIKERRQTVDGRTFVVCSVFDRFANKNANDKLLTLVKSDVGK